MPPPRAEPLEPGRLATCGLLPRAVVGAGKVCFPGAAGPATCVSARFRGVHAHSMALWSQLSGASKACSPVLASAGCVRACACPAQRATGAASGPAQRAPGAAACAAVPSKPWQRPPTPAASPTTFGNAQHVEVGGELGADHQRLCGNACSRPSRCGRCGHGRTLPGGPGGGGRFAVSSGVGCMPAGPGLAAAQLSEVGAMRRLGPPGARPETRQAFLDNGGKAAS